MIGEIEPGDLVFWFMALWTVYLVEGSIAVLRRPDGLGGYIQQRAALDACALWKKAKGR